MAIETASRKLRELRERLTALRDSCTVLEREHLERVRLIDRATRSEGAMPGAASSAANLLHYIAVRRHDLRDLHEPLAALGLSSLGRMEGHVLSNLDAVISALEALAGPDSSGDVERAGAAAGDNQEQQTGVSLVAARELIERRTMALLGPPRSPAHIMVTLPTEAATDSSLVRALLHAGMTSARINTAHDGPAEWTRMCEIVRDEAAQAGVQCRIVFDLAGPKLRTGPIEPGPRVLRIKPVRDTLGRVTAPGRLVLRPQSLHPAGAGEAPVADEWLSQLRRGDGIELFDTRGRRRLLRVEEIDEAGRVRTRSESTVYIATGTHLRLLKAGDRERDALIGELPAVAQSILVRPGDRLTLSLRERLGRPAPPAPAGTPGGAPLAPAVITCAVPEAFEHIKAGEPVWIDDGRIGARVESVSPDAVELMITYASPAGDRIRADKGINLPETDIDLSGLTDDDIAVLPVAARHADVIGLSFVREEKDVLEVRRRLRELGGGHIGTILKIETRRAFENLPGLLLAALEGPSAGVMIARGDLAVEVGYDRLAEVQEEILWLCEAAHLPVIWATQVLETMAKTGRPSRAEVTDAAMAERAECVMLNKGPYIVEAVRFLDDLVRRMHHHQSKKRQMLRALGVAKRFGGGDAARA